MDGILFTDLGGYNVFLLYERKFMIYYESHHSVLVVVQNY